MRAKTVPHVEYEIFMHIINNVDVESVRTKLCPTGDKVAKERFEKGFTSAAKLIDNLCKRRQHRLPKNHVDYRGKDE